MQSNDMVRVFVGYDARETVSFSVLSHSIHVRSSLPVSVTPVMLSQLTGVFHRERDPLQSTDFSFSRFLTPYLAGYQGWAVFMDCDMLMLDDIANLWALRDDDYALMCVKHNHVPKEETKFLGEKQTKYAYKNWSSVMMFNCAKCTALTPDYVNTATGLQLHQFKWLESDELIGEVPRRWNHLVGVSEPLEDPALLHYTVGGPYFDAYKDCEYSAEWFRERDDMLYAMKPEEAKVEKSQAAE
ncbi:MAG: glycosyltransferase [Alphaproteobacteria bacterium]